MSFDLILPFFSGQIQDLLLDERISDLCINGDRNVFVERDGVMSLVEGLQMQREHINAVVEQIARVLGRDITENDPIQDLRLPNGSRVGAVYSPCSPHGPTLTIRKFNRWYTTNELVQYGSLPASVRDIVVEAIVK